jgi:NAD dependent epimerase/dehydratase family enzyme
VLLDHSRDDLVALLVEALRNPDYSGVYNGTAPNPVRMSELCSSLGAVLHAQYTLHIFALAQLRHGC